MVAVRQDHRRAGSRHQEVAARIADRGRMTTSTDPVVSAQHHELVKNELFAFARYLYGEIESHTSVNITFDESVWDYT